MYNTLAEPIQKRRLLYKNWDLILLLLYNLGILFFVLAFCQPVYETNDDFTISIVSMGVFGDNYKQYLAFSNIIYGYVIKFLTNIIPLINWWIVLQYIIIVLSYTAIFYLLCIKTNISIALLSNMIVGCLVIYNQIRYIQFTRTAFIACIAGLLLLMFGSIHTSRKSIIIGFIMCLLGSWIRERCFWLSMAYAGAFFVAYVFHTEFNLDKIKKLAKVLGFMTIIVLLSSFINGEYYAGDSEWDEYKRFNSVRANLLDYSMPLWEENRERYESIGFSQNDVILFTKWNYNDTNKYTLENLSEIDSWNTKEKIDWNTIRDLFQKICQNIQQNFLVVWIISLIILLVSRSRAGVILAILNFLGTIIVFLFFYYQGRMVARVEFGIWISAILMNFYGYSEFRIGGWNSVHNIEAKCVKISAILGMILFMTVNVIALEGQSVYQGNTRELLSCLAENSSNLYILDVESLGNACFCFSPWKKVDSFYLRNYCWSGGWDTFSPYWKSYNKILGFDNPFEDLCTKDNVLYVIDKDISILFAYLQENYKISEVELVESYNDRWNVYKFY